MKSYTFCVDRELKLLAAECAPEAEDTAPAPWRGAPYDAWFPRFRDGEGDAIERAVRDGVPISLSGYRLFCLFGDLQLADVEIVPLFDASSRCSGAEVTVTPLKCCPRIGENERSRSLIDIGKVSATLAHGVRNPLNAIKGAVVYLREKYRSDRTFVEFADIIDEEIHRLDDFITEFLSTSFMHTTKSETDLNEFVDRIAKLVTLQAQSGSVEFRRDFGAIPVVSIDTFNMGHAILNVINNALEAMPNGGTLTLRTSMTRDEGAEYAAVEVTDTGTGGAGEVEMPNGTEPVREGRGRGRGFGLFITREIVRFHGGRLQITSARDGGTTVRVLLPVPASAERGYDR